ncbi:hypothetical protein BBBOND_0303650 [Babesia bigemina]|uniref:Uncharacterized protein n=1 Tax=Babesia bigemina TaxID=5866 RepID=A0A061D6Y1_BABBI|nr:hypothetical protein BBBOND_0303650 [Babesia bigemina]CDR96461.1 hypothetical protein BBBOND_0303650 [Babesia bigemina]|eukprot:XP_012768647.1 hypothetical protein BBBOND_0303650 [Babesia bigemina]
MAPQFKKLTDCPENLREAIDWLIQVRHGGNDNKGLEKLGKALKEFIADAIWNTQNSLDKKRDEIDKIYDVAEKLSKIAKLDDQEMSFINLQKDLEPFLENLQINSKDPDKSILTRLCTGLETFLGFNKDSKGYTGQGIVYSDMDRLCDAVMAFLHGVLESVKDDDAVTTYDRYVKIESKDGLDTVLDFIVRQIGKGREGLLESVMRVRQWLEGYERRVGERTGNVRDILNSLRSRINDRIDDITEQRQDSLKDQLNYWQTVTQDFLGMSETAKNFLRDLDQGFQKQLDTSANAVIEAIKVLETSTNNKGFTMAVTAVQNAFDTLPGEVDKFISDNIKSTIMEHKAKVELLKKEVKEKMDASRDTFMINGIKMAKVDLMKAVITFSKNAMNMGGLNNSVVKQVIETLEKRLKDDAEKVNDANSLNALKSNPVEMQIVNIITSLNGKMATDSTNGLSSLMEKIVKPEDVFRDNHDAALLQLVNNAKNDMQKALECADEHAKNRGGLNNNAVARVISAIQNKLDQEAERIETLDKLKELKRKFMDGEQITQITNALSKDSTASHVKSGLQQLTTSIEAPEELFRKAHQDKLAGLAQNAEDDLEKLISKAQECIKTHGGVNNRKFLKVIINIEGKLGSLESSNGIIDTFQKLKALKNPYMDGQIRSITTTLNDNDAASNVKSSLEGPKMSIKAPDKIFNDTHKTNLDRLAGKAQEDLQNAIDNAIKYVESSQGSLQRNIVGAFEGVLKSFKQGQKTVTELKNTIEKEFKRLTNISTTLTISHKGNVQSKLNQLDENKILAVKGILKPQTSEQVSEDQLNSWFKSANSYLLTYVLGEANDEIIKADHEYQTAVKAQLMQIKSKIKNFEQKAETNNLGDITSDLESNFLYIQSAITNHSVYETDKSGRQEYFNHLTILITDTVSILKTAYQKAYSTTAKTYLSGAIKEIKERVENAEEQYKDTVIRLIQKIEGTVSEIKNRAGKDKLEELSTSLKHFEDIQSAITTKSVFSEDIIERQQFFENLKSQINNTVATLHQAYKNAYQSAAKSYLSGAIMTIKYKVEAAEGTYKAAIRGCIEQVRNKITTLQDADFKQNSDRARLTAKLTSDFGQLEAEVAKNSAFDEDFTSRKQCFTQLQTLIKNTVETLSSFYEKAYQSAAKTYLSNAIKNIKDEVQKAEVQYARACKANSVDIKNMIMQLRDESTKKELERFVTDLTQPFDNWIYAIRKNSAFQMDYEGRKQCFEKLKDLIRNTVNTIILAATTFDTCASRAVIYLTESFKNAETGIDKLGVGIMDKVKAAFDKVITEVYAMYSEDKIALLKSLKNCVEEQKREVDRIIGIELKKGIKGFLHLLKMWIDKKSGDLKKAQDLKSLADLFEHLNKHLHRYVKFQHDGLEVGDDSDDDDDDSLSPTPAVRQVTPSISGGGYRARPAVQSVSSKDPNAPQPAGRAGYLGKVRTPSTGQQFLSPQLTKDPISDCFDRIDHHTRGLFGTLSAGYFSKSFASKREEFVQFLDSIRPFKSGEHCDTLLYILMSCLQSFLKELGKAYISTYCGAAYVFEWELDGEKCAKAFLTILEILYHDLDGLRNKCKDAKLYRANKLCLKEDDNRRANHLGIWFDHRGFTVSDNKDKQDGELDTNKTGENIIGMIAGTSVTTAAKNIYKGQDDTTGALKSLHEYLEDYYRVCHHRLIPDARAPTTIYEMLHWLGGLWYNPVAEPLRDSLRKLLEDVERENKVETDKLQVALPYRRSVSMSRTLTRNELIYVFNNSTIRSNLLLIAILGHGQEDGRYACDFLTNPDDLLYPSNPDKCLDLLVEVSLRVNHQIRFLFKQCHNGPECGGWRDCLYGKGIGGSRWQCNKLQCPNQECEQKCRQHYSCGVKSPLQLFLEDGLLGFLPHPFEKPDCKITCSLQNHNGIPCKTPMGFRDLSIRASHQQKGERIKKVLDWFCGTENESLNLLCSYFLLLLRRPPQTLCDMFAFYYNFLDHYDDDRSTQKEHRRLAFNNAVTKANLGRPFGALNPSTILCTSKHVPSDGKPTHEKGDLFGVLSCNPEDSPTMPCGRYLQSIGDDIRLLYYGEHASVYLSWIIYQAETFYNLLRDLCDKCCKKCTSPKSICYGTRCTRDCQVKTVYESNKSDDHKADLKALDGKKHNDECNSIVNCSNTHSILYTYGFTFGSPFDLSGGNNKMEKKRTCKDFCRALDNVLNKEKDVEAPLAKLVFDIIPEYLWVIREPFFYTTVALWLLSLFYLLHIMVIRLDLLHIKSHLHSPSSHRIAAQSLLAAARVGRLSKISYLQT